MDVMTKIFCAESKSGAAIKFKEWLESMQEKNMLPYIYQFEQEELDDGFSIVISFELGVREEYLGQ